MALGFGFRRPAAALDDPCDRCGQPGAVRYAKNGVVCMDDDGAEVKRVYLVHCGFHADLNGSNLAAQGFVIVAVAR